jgi:major membrane immunogen (membrane-anchored lipoprotein)
MKKSVLVLALLLLAALGGCTRGEDLKDTITFGTWRVGYYVSAGDVDTSKFSGYVFTFLTDGTVTVARPGLPVANGTWDEHDSDTRLDLNFNDSGLIQRLDEDWVVDRIFDDEVQLHKLGAPGTQVTFELR